jgi:transposase InsO family protein
VIRVAVAASLSRPVGLAPICKELGIARSTLYAQRVRAAQVEPLGKRGPRPIVPDDELLAAIKSVLTDPPFMGEGYRKVHARLRYMGIRADEERVRLLMRDHGLQAPGRPRRELGPRIHDGRIITSMPDQMWGTDATSVLLLDGQQATLFGVYDHCTCELMGIHAALKADRFEAITTLQQATRMAFGSVGAAIAAGLKLRHDNGSQFVSRAFQAELRFLGMESSPSFVRAPEGNGCIERFWRTLKEQLLWIKTFATIEELNLALKTFQNHYNQNWLIGRHGHRPPATVRQDLLGQGKAA